VIAQGLVDFVINVTREYDQYGRPDGYWIRRQAVDAGVPLVTDLQLARAVVEASRSRKSSSLEVRALNDYVATDVPLRRATDRRNMP
jgi:carbamoyl-phosphate synthase large subunit